MNKNYIKLSIALFAFMSMTNNASAFNTPPRCAPGEQETSAPFDGGISLLVAAGIGYASKKGYDKRKKTAEVPTQEK